MYLNKNILNELPEEIKVLWSLSKRTKIDNANIRHEVQKAVSRARMRVSSNFSVDKLDRKLECFGNSGGWGLHKVKELSKIVFTDKGAPEGEHGEWLSVELELVMPNKAAEISFVSFVRKSGFTKFVTVKHDGSIKLKQCECNEETDDEGNAFINHEEDCEADGFSAYGREIVITFKYGNWDFVKSICNKLNSLKCTVNKSCGLHVHFDMRHCTNARQVSTIAQRVAKAVPALKQMLPASRQDNEFCEQTINRINDSENRRNRYAFVNTMAYQRHKTLEIRGHSGTTDAIKIINWIRILREVMAKPNRSEIVSIQAMMTKIQFDEDLQVYMLARQAKFAKHTRQTDDVSNDNRLVETGQPELFNIGPSTTDIRISIDHAQDAERYAYTVNLSGQTYQLTEEQLRGALDGQNIEPLLAELRDSPESNQNASVA